MKKIGLTKREVSKIARLSELINELRDKIDDSGRDYELSFGNGYVSEQLDCASAALDCILQEF